SGDRTSEARARDFSKIARPAAGDTSRRSQAVSATAAEATQRPCADRPDAGYPPGSPLLARGVPRGSPQLHPGSPLYEAAVPFARRNRELGPEGESGVAGLGAAFRALSDRYARQ